LTGACSDLAVKRWNASTIALVAVATCPLVKGTVLNEILFLITIIGMNRYEVIRVRPNEEVEPMGWKSEADRSFLKFILD
jgi:hypothetical protein